MLITLNNCVNKVLLCTYNTIFFSYVEIITIFRVSNDTQIKTPPYGDALITLRHTF